MLRITLTTQASLGTSDYCNLNQFIEGPQFRELQNDVHSLSLLVRSSVAGLKFGVALRDPPVATKSLTMLCQITSANVWQVIQLPNLPTWPSGNFSYGPGVVGYQLAITLAAGSLMTSAANSTWQSSNAVGAIGQDNFFNKPVNSTFDIAFCQHEPGSVCSTFQNKTFIQNLDECLRYYTKSYNYTAAVGSAGTGGRVITMPFASQPAYCYVPFQTLMAKTPTITGYSDSTGAINTVRDNSASVDRAISATATPSDSGFNGFTLGTVNAGSALYTYHYTADTGW
jgi:hypothetical protein